MKTIQMDIADYLRDAAKFVGLCLECGEFSTVQVVVSGEGYDLCEWCNEWAMCGIEQAVCLGRVVVTDEPVMS